MSKSNINTLNSSPVSCRLFHSKYISCCVSSPLDAAATTLDTLYRDFVFCIKEKKRKKNKPFDVSRLCLRFHFY